MGVVTNTGKGRGFKGEFIPLARVLLRLPLILFGVE